MEVHAGQGLKVGLYTPTILGVNSYVSWFHDRGAILIPARTGRSKGLSQAIKRGPIRKFLPKYVNVYVTIQSYVTANGVRNGLSTAVTSETPGDWCDQSADRREKPHLGP